MAGAWCDSCSKVVYGSHACTEFRVQPTTAPAPATGTLAASPATWTTFPQPTSVLCSCGKTYRYGDAHICFGPSTVESSPELLAFESMSRSLQRIAVALEKLAERAGE